MHEVDRVTRRKLLKVATGLLIARKFFGNPPRGEAQAAETQPDKKLTTGVNMFNALGTHDIEGQFQALAGMGGSVVRLMVPHMEMSAEASSKQLGKVLEAARSADILVLPVLTDAHGDTKFHTSGTDEFYTNEHGGVPVLDQGFYEGGYRDAGYQDLVARVVTENRGAPNIYAWEAVNEPFVRDNPATLIPFMRDVSSTIKAADPNHPVASGLATTRHAGLDPSFYDEVPQVDIVTIHTYDRENMPDVLEDISAARGKRTVIIEEMGFSGSNRPDKFEDGIRDMQGEGVAVVLAGAYTPKGYHDSGNTDRLYGIDDIWHRDYRALHSVWRSYGRNSVGPA